jgi:hypothetical protein
VGGAPAQPTASLARFEYRVVLTGTDATIRETAPFGVDVSPEGCPLRDDSAAQASIVVLVPPGAPIVPPVPAGFSPVGASAPEEQRRLAPRRTAGGRNKLLVIGTGVLAGGASAVLAGGGSREADGTGRSEALVIPSFTFTTTIPPPGSPVSSRSGQFGVVVTMDKEPNVPLPVDFRITLISPGETVCAAMNGTYPGALRPLGLVLSAPLTPIGSCGQTFEVQRMLLSLNVNDRRVLSETVTLERPVRFEP